jgi:Rrf2 family protein
MGVSTSSSGGYSSIRDIAVQTGISEGYLEQLFIPLRKEGFVEGVRGPQGGYSLAKPPNEIIVGDILRAVEGSLCPTDCVDSLACPMSRQCQSRNTWAGLNDVINEFVDSITLGDLIINYERGEGQEYTI